MLLQLQLVSHRDASRTNASRTNNNNAIIVDGGGDVVVI